MTTSHHAFAALAIISLGVIIVVVIIAGSHTDHQSWCDSTPHNTNKNKHRDVYKLADGQPFSRLLTPYKEWAYSDHQYGHTPTSLAESLCKPLSYMDVQHTFHYKRYQNKLSNMAWVWGQFVDHILILTDKDQSLPWPPGTHRTKASVDKNGQRQQLNQRSPYLDAATIYGDDYHTIHHLRTKDGSGKLKTTKSPYTHEDMPPFNEARSEYKTGDPRSSEHYVLTSLHTLWIREHNYWTDLLHKKHPTWNGDKLFWTSMDIVISEIQSITYQEWLPAILGSESLWNRLACYRGDKMYASIRNEYAGAVGRFGHAMVTNTLVYRDTKTNQLTLTKDLLEAFMEPHLGQGVENGTLWHTGIGGWLLGSCIQPARARQPCIVEALRGHFDLSAINMARGRDHELPSFQETWLHIYEKPLTNWGQVTDNEEHLHLLRDTIGHIGYPMDLWMGTLLEKPYRQSILGKLATEIVAEQFAHIRDTDPYFYLWNDDILVWRDEIHMTRLSEIIRRNTDIDSWFVPPDVFRV